MEKINVEKNLTGADQIGGTHESNEMEDFLLKKPNN
jgi:hypothetical protein